MFPADCLKHRHNSESLSAGADVWQWPLSASCNCHHWELGIQTCSQFKQWLIFDGLLCAPRWICLCSEETQALGEISERISERNTEYNFTISNGQKLAINKYLFVIKQR